MKRLLLTVAFLFTSLVGVSIPANVEAAGTCSSWFTSSTSARAKCTNYPVGYTRVQAVIWCRSYSTGYATFWLGPWVLANTYYSSNANCSSGYYGISHSYRLK